MQTAAARKYKKIEDFTGEFLLTHELQSSMQHLGRFSDVSVKEKHGQKFSKLKSAVAKDLLLAANKNLDKEIAKSEEDSLESVKDFVFESLRLQLPRYYKQVKINPTYDVKNYATGDQASIKIEICFNDRCDILKPDFLYLETTNFSREKMKDSVVFWFAEPNSPFYDEDWLANYELLEMYKWFGDMAVQLDKSGLYYQLADKAKKLISL